ncbi:MAG: type IV toxin-antitoxin system AbiEi family antitoxin domain-containing protein [Dysgonamonadaceae bacterium]|jgi:predicted transcriptional regulator of viral defense system|nr:type IV toxin-antitoxin system AbiEi family antitoxin domain-containing protein [Dysgonamonadaceae bacterium]
MKHKLQILFNRNRGYLTRKQLPDKSLYNHLLKLVGEGIVERVKQGVYRYENGTFDSTMIDLEKIIPNGVLCLYSAWAYYGLSVQIPQSFHVAIEKNRKVSLPDYPPIKLYYWKRDYQELGITKQKTGDFTVMIYNLEKSVCDAIKYRTKTGTDVTSEVLNNYLKRKDRNLSLLMEYAKKMRIEKILKTYLEIGL